ncbi:MAG TPA: hypothetical protein VNZ56_15730 [Verrucomicrobiae bacterium]|nr:hypothetical protein [Verrucomicrobiae bacterium]
MWALLYVDETGRVAGWFVDTYSEKGTTPFLSPRMNWFSREDEKPCRAQPDIGDFVSSIKVGPEDEAIEPQREAFIRATLADWEQEYAESVRPKA